MTLNNCLNCSRYIKPYREVCFECEVRYMISTTKAIDLYKITYTTIKNADIFGIYFQMYNVPCAKYLIKDIDKLAKEYTTDKRAYFKAHEKYKRNVKYVIDKFKENKNRINMLLITLLEKSDKNYDIESIFSNNIKNYNWLYKIDELALNEYNLAKINDIYKMIITSII